MSGLPKTSIDGSRRCSPPGGETWLIWRCRAAPSGPTWPSSRSKALARLKLGDIAFRHLTRAAAAFVLLLLSGVIVSLIIGAWPALQQFGPGFLVSERWNPVTENFGALAPIYGTLVTSLIAMLIAVPIGLMIAMFLTELCPQWLRRPIGIAIELLAGIPSIIYGIWGLFVFAPFLQETLQPFLIATFGERSRAVARCSPARPTASAC